LIGGGSAGAGAPKVFGIPATITYLTHNILIVSHIKLIETVELSAKVIMRVKPPQPRPHRQPARQRSRLTFALRTEKANL